MAMRGTSSLVSAVRSPLATRNDNPQTQLPRAKAHKPNSAAETAPTSTRSRLPRAQFRSGLAGARRSTGAPRVPVLDESVDDSEDEVFFGGIKTPERKRATALKRRRRTLLQHPSPSRALSETRREAVVTAAVLRLQAGFRRWHAQRQLAAARTAVTTITRHWRARQRRERFRTTVNAAVAAARDEAQRKRHVARLMARHRAAVTLQVWWRYCLWRRTLRQLPAPAPKAVTPTKHSLIHRTLAERLAQASPAATRQPKPHASPFAALAGSSRWRPAAERSDAGTSTAVVALPLPLPPANNSAVPSAAPDSLEAKRALLLKIRSQRKRLETQLLTQAGAGALPTAQTATGATPVFASGPAKSGSLWDTPAAGAAAEEGASATLDTAMSSFARLAARNRGNAGKTEETAQERDQHRTTRFNTLHNSHSLVTFELPGPDDFDAQEQFLDMIDARQGLAESPAKPRPTSRVQWKAVLCRDTPATPPGEAARTILRRRDGEHVFPFADSLHPQRVVVLPKVRGTRRGSSQLDMSVPVGELLAGNRDEC